MQKRSARHGFTAEEFARAAEGRPFAEKEWFRWMSNKEVAACPAFGLSEDGLTDWQRWLVIQDAECSDPENWRQLKLAGMKGSDTGPGFIFYRCELPRFWLSDSRIEDCFFIGTQVTSVVVEDRSQCRNLRFYEDSHAGAVSVGKEAVCDKIACGGGSIINDLEVWEHAHCGSVDIGNGRLDQVTVTGHSKVKYLTVEYGEVREIEFEPGSECEQVWCRGGKIGSVRVTGSRCDDVSVVEGGAIGWLTMKDTQCDQVLVSDSEVRKMELDRCRIAKLELGFKARGEVYLDGCDIGHFPLVRTILPAEATVSIVRCRIYVIQWQELTVLGRLFLRDCGVLESPVGVPEKEICPESPKPLLRIAECSMGKTEIVGCRLEDFTVECRNSNLSEAFITFV
jgi:hypothetical protein